MIIIFTVSYKLVCMVVIFKFSCNNSVHDCNCFNISPLSLLAEPMYYNCMNISPLLQLAEPTYYNCMNISPLLLGTDVL